MSEHQRHARNGESTGNADQIPGTEEIQQILWDVYIGVFEQLLGGLLATAIPERLHVAQNSSYKLWIPCSSTDEEYVQHWEAISISELFVQLDEWMGKPIALARASTSNGPAQRMSRLGEPLLNAVNAFSSRWLRLSLSGTGSASIGACEQMTRTLWRTARTDMLRVMNRPSYRSVLALFLFGLTPVPRGISEDEELSGLSGQTSLQAALQMQQTLRTRPRTWQFSMSEPLINRNSACMENRSDFLTDDRFLDAESYAYWTGFIFDTTTSLTLDRQPILCAGLLGINAEATFELIKRRSLLFQVDMKTWLESEAQLVDESGMTVIAAAALWKIYTYKRIAVFKEALRDGHRDTTVMEAFTEVLTAMEDFKRAYRPSLDVLEKKLQFLSRKTRYEWCECSLKPREFQIF